MEEKFRSYRIASSRDKSWDYNNEGSYQITICIKNRICHFGEVMKLTDIQRHDDWEKRVTSADIHDSHAVLLSPEGIIVRDIWKEISVRFPMASCEDIMIMPDHIHGIINISRSSPTKEKQRPMMSPILNLKSANCNVGKGKFLSADHVGGATASHNPMLFGGLSNVIRWFKGKTTFYIRKHIPGFSWQSRFHDHIIRNPDAYRKVVKYMNENPFRWSERGT